MEDQEHAALRKLGSQLEEGGFVTSLKMRQGDVPSQLHVTLSPDAQQRLLQLELMFLPGTSALPVLQIFIGLPYVIVPDQFGDLFRFLSAANVHALVGAFGYVEQRSLLYYRCNVATEYEDIDSQAVGWSMAAATYLVQTVGPLVEAVANGLSFEEAAEQLVEVVAADAEAAQQL